MEITRKAQSGHYYKTIPEFGTLVFSPYTGLTYAISLKLSQKVVEWLEGSKATLPKSIASPLKVGWKIPLNNAVYTTNQLLPDKSFWKDYSQPNEIIAINWFLTGLCNFKCDYCYASDLMYEHTKEPIYKEIEQTSKRLLSYNPLYVVLTGGEPFVSPHIESAIKLLTGKVGIIIDTNGTQLKEHDFRIIKQNNIVLRISLDSPRPQLNLKHRVPKELREQSYNIILKNISRSVEYKIPTIIQTVVSSQNKNELVEFGDILVRLGVNGWRIQKIQESFLNKANFNKLMLGRIKKLDNASDQIDKKLHNTIKMQHSRWNSKISLQVSRNTPTDRNSVILVAPDGRFWTESQIQVGKKLIDSNSPWTPNKELLFSKINPYSHFSRYLNLY